MSTKIQVTRRFVHSPFGGRGRNVYDAEGAVDGIDYYVSGAATAKEARMLARMQLAFKAANEGVAAEGYRLEPSHYETFVLKFPHGGAHLFGARTTRDALLRVAREYQDNLGVRFFITAVLRNCLEIQP